MLRLKSGVDYFVSTKKDRLVIYPSFGSSVYEVSQPYQPMLDVLNALSEPIAETELNDFLLKDPEGRRGESVDYLKSKQLIIANSITPELAQDELTRFQRQLAYFEQSSAYADNPPTIQMALGNSCVAIVGCGGAGAPVSELLAGAGIGKIRLIDHDSVELGNLGRQIAYSPKDIGQKKVAALKERLCDINDGIAVEAIPLLLDGLNAQSLLRDSDFVVVAADEPLPQIMNWIDNACQAFRLPYACISNSPPTLRIGPIISPKHGMKYQDYMSAITSRWPDVTSYEEVANRYSYNKATTVWTCYAAAALLVGQVVQYVAEGDCRLLGRSALFDMEQLRCWEGVNLHAEE